MKILTRYISIELIKLLIFCQFIIVSLFLMIDFVQKLDWFIDNDAFRADVIFPYFLYKVPYLMVQFIPVATLISVIVLFRLMRNNREIMAIRACGINIFMISQTVVIIALLISFGSFVFSETVVPYAYSKSNEIWDIKVKKKDPATIYGNDQIWYKSSDAIYWIKHFDSARKIMQDTTMYFFNKNFKLVKRINAKRGVWQDGKWRMEEGIIQELKTDGEYSYRRFDKELLVIPETPETFLKRIKQPEEMSYNQLHKFSDTAKNEGYDNTPYLVEMSVKTAFPFISLVLTLLGIPIALQLKTGGIPLAVASGIGLSFLYMIILSISRAFGLSGVLPPFLSAWTANLLFIFVGIYLMMTVER